MRHCLPTLAVCLTLAGVAVLTGCKDEAGVEYDNLQAEYDQAMEKVAEINRRWVDDEFIQSDQSLDTESGRIDRAGYEAKKLTDAAAALDTFIKSAAPGPESTDDDKTNRGRLEAAARKIRARLHLTVAQQDFDAGTTAAARLSDQATRLFSRFIDVTRTASTLERVKNETQNTIASRDAVQSDLEQAETALNAARTKLGMLTADRDAGVQQIQTLTTQRDAAAQKTSDLIAQSQKESDAVRDEEDLAKRKALREQSQATFVKAIREAGAEAAQHDTQIETTQSKVDRLNEEIDDLELQIKLLGEKVTAFTQGRTAVETRLARLDKAQKYLMSGSDADAETLQYMATLVVSAGGSGDVNALKAGLEKFVPSLRSGKADIDKRVAALAATYTNDVVAPYTKALAELASAREHLEAAKGTAGLPDRETDWIIAALNEITVTEASIRQSHIEAAAVFGSTLQYLVQNEAEVGGLPPAVATQLAALQTVLAAEKQALNGLQAHADTGQASGSRIKLVANISKAQSDALTNFKTRGAAASITAPRPAAAPSN